MNSEKVKNQLVLYFDVNPSNIMSTQWIKFLDHLQEYPYGIQQIAEYFTPLIQHLQIDIPGLSSPLVYDLNNAENNSVTINEQITQIIKKCPKLKSQTWKSLDSHTFIVIKYSCINHDIMNMVENPIYCYYQLDPKLNYINAEKLVQLNQPLNPQDLIAKSKKEQKQQTISSFDLLCESLQITKQNSQNLQLISQATTSSQYFYWNMGYIYKESKEFKEQQIKLIRRPFILDQRNQFGGENQQIEKQSQKWWNQVEQFSGQQFLRFLKSQNFYKKSQDIDKVPQDLKQYLYNNNVYYSQITQSFRNQIIQQYNKQLEDNNGKLLISSAGVKSMKQLEKIINLTFEERISQLNQDIKSIKIEQQQVPSQQKYFCVRPTHVLCADQNIFQIHPKRLEKLKKEIKQTYGQVYGFDEELEIKIVNDDSQKKIYQFTENPTK